MMTPRERVRKALNHETPDRVPVDLGATWVTGIAASAYARLRPALGLKAEPPKINEPLQLLGTMEDDVREKLGIDVVGLWPQSTIFGFRNRGWKPWTLQDGTEVLVSKEFETTVDEQGDTLVYPKGDRTAQPSGRLPKGGFYFDSIVRQGPLDEDHLDPNDWAEQFGIYSDEDLEELRRQADALYNNTQYAIISNFGQGGLGDIAVVPGEMLLNPKGLRDPNLWYEFLALHPDYIQGIFELQSQAAMKNLKLLHQAVGNKLDAVIISGTDFGTQRGSMISPAMFRKLWKPSFTQFNAWVHQNTTWKTFYHTCGSVVNLLDDFVEMGMDILNPVQCSAAGMDPVMLKEKYGKKLVFWGGGVDTQKTLPFGTPREVYDEVRERIRVFNQDGGFIFNPIHNVQAPTPVENILAMFRAIRDSAG